MTKRVVVYTTLIAEALGVDADGFEFKTSLGYTARRCLVLLGIRCHLYNQPWAIERSKKCFLRKGYNAGHGGACL